MRPPFRPPVYEARRLDVAAELTRCGAADGLLTIIGNDGMDCVIGPLNALFADFYPGARFETRLRGSATAIPALIAGASWFAPMSRDPWTEDQLAFQRARGYDPTAVRLGYTGHGPRMGGRTPPAFYVHASNPIAGLSLDQLQRVLTTGTAQGDIQCWGQLGLAEPWRGRRIHVYGLRDVKYARGLRDQHLSGLPYASHYEALASREEVIRALAQDPFGIGTVGWIQANAISQDVRVLPLSRSEYEPFHSPDLATIARGEYALKAWVSFFVDLAPGQRMAALLREYLLLALSRQGQAIIGDCTHAREGYVPLCEADWMAQRARWQML